MVTITNSALQICQRHTGHHCFYTAGQVGPGCTVVGFELGQAGLNCGLGRASDCWPMHISRRPRICLDMSDCQYTQSNSDWYSADADRLGVLL